MMRPRLHRRRIPFAALGSVVLFSTASGCRVGLEALRTPTLICYGHILERNAITMRKRAESLGCSLRPHVKTVKTSEGAALATGGSRRRVTCSTLAEAHFLADRGFDDILYAVPLTPDKIADAVALHTRLDAFHVMVDHPEHVAALLREPTLASTASAGPHRPLSVFVSVDCGYHREGVDPHSEASVELVRSLSESSGATSFAGVYTHAGHSYDASTPTEIAQIAAAERDVTVGFAQRLRAAGLPVPCVGVGSTPTCSLPPETLEGVDEMHPGNYLYYDMTQLALGSCGADEIAVRILTRVVGHYPQSNTLLIDCGWTGASAQGKEAGYGGFLEHPELRIANLKQECGEVTSADGTPLEYERYPIGSFLQIAPFHSCASTHQHAQVHVIGADGDVAASWEICKGW